MRPTARLLLALTLLVSMPAAAKDIPARLYVRTTPPGAKVILDGKRIGVSDELFVVAPGRHVVRLVREGFVSQQHRLDLPAERITRLVVVMKRIAAPVADSSAARAAEAFVRRAKVPQAARSAILTVLRQHPGESRWCGQSGVTLFALAAKRLPKGAVRQRVAPTLLNLCHSLAVHELLTAKSLLDRYRSAGLDDATTLRQAVTAAAGELEITGRTQGVEARASVDGDFAVAYVLAEGPKLTAHLLEETQLAKVRDAYRDVMHKQARGLMARKNWKDAVLLWRHLHARKLASQALYLDAAKCFKELHQTEDAIRILTEAVTAFEQTATAAFLEQAGDVALSLETPAAEKLAEQAYKAASARLKDSITGEKETDR